MKHILFLFSAIIVLNCEAHSGGTNLNGCHTNHQTGEYHCHNPKQSSIRTPTSESADYQVTFNTRSRKFHRPKCMAAKSCTVNCISLTKSQAISRNGVPCGICGG